jgi:GH18 family chitinase
VNIVKENSDWVVVQPNPEALGPYAVSGGNQWVGYDDETSVRKKSDFVFEHRLGGIMFWTIDNDDFRAMCNGKAYPLIEAAKESYLNGVKGTSLKTETTTAQTTTVVTKKRSRRTKTRKTTTPPPTTLVGFQFSCSPPNDSLQFFF